MVSTFLQTLRGSVVRKSEVLRDLFSPSGQCFDMCHLSCPYPLDPRIQLLGVAPEQCSVFKSALTPLRLSFRALLPQQSGDGAMPADDGRGLAMAQVSSDPWEFPDTHSIQPPEATVTDPVRQQQSPVVLQRGQGGSRIVGGASGSQMPVRQQATDFLSRKAFVAPHSPLVTMIYKKGDDLRQDQLVVHMFSLMDRWVEWVQLWSILLSVTLCLHYYCLHQVIVVYMALWSSLSLCILINHQGPEVYSFQI